MEVYCVQSQVVIEGTRFSIFCNNTESKGVCYRHHTDTRFTDTILFCQLINGGSYLLQCSSWEPQ